MRRDPRPRRSTTPPARRAATRPIHPVVKQTKPEVTSKDLPHAYARYITIDRASYTLRFFHRLRLEKSYLVAVGQQGLETPAGLYHVLDKQVNPSWHVPTPPGPAASPGR